MPLLFSYGTLQLEAVQIESFGRKLNGSLDVLTGYELSEVEIHDSMVLSRSQQKFHPVAIPGTIDDLIEGTVFDITDEELVQADTYEVSDYKRVSVVLKSGKTAWAYVAASTT